MASLRIWLDAAHHYFFMSTRLAAPEVILGETLSGVGLNKGVNKGWSEEPTSGAVIETWRAAPNDVRQPSVDATKSLRRRLALRIVSLELIYWRLVARRIVFKVFGLSLRVGDYLFSSVSQFLRNCHLIRSVPVFGDSDRNEMPGESHISRPAQDSKVK